MFRLDPACVELAQDIKARLFGVHGPAHEEAG
jgi:hypothetical protein